MKTAGIIVSLAYATSSQAAPSLSLSREISFSPSLSHRLLPCHTRSGSSIGFPITSMQPLAVLHFQCVSATPASLHTSSSLPPSSLLLNLSFFFPSPFSLLSLCLKASVLLYRVVISSFSHPPQSLQRSSPGNAVGESPSQTCLHSEQSCWTGATRKERRRKSKGRECCSDWEEAGFSAWNRGTVNIEQTREKRSQKRAEHSEKGGKLHKKRNKKQEKKDKWREVKERIKSKGRYSNYASQHFLCLSLLLPLSFLPPTAKRQRKTFFLNGSGGGEAKWEPRPPLWEAKSRFRRVSRTGRPTAFRGRGTQTKDFILTKPQTQGQLTGRQITLSRHRKTNPYKNFPDRTKKKKKSSDWRRGGRRRRRAEQDRLIEKHINKKTELWPLQCPCIPPSSTPCSPIASQPRWWCISGWVLGPCESSWALLRDQGHTHWYNKVRNTDIMCGAVSFSACSVISKVLVHQMIRSVVLNLFTDVF